ncbi:glycosyltransferase family 4 protein [Candidatus Levibacter sp. Uisw_134_01]|uniref:glycosyltransferase family 4 protein n=1 Tax=Candidatus Levibacter sp. Uisw_134_01 TaxID=3230999 RepID=UPI003D4C8702
MRSLKTKDVSHIFRTFAELCMPFVMLWNIRKSPISTSCWDGIVWYSPSIFHGPLVKALKKSSGCKSYLIIRDIFPNWLLDMGLIKRGLSYFLLNAVARYQYSIADVIGVQTSGNLNYFELWKQKSGRKLKVLKNWLDKPARVSCSIKIDQTVLVGRKIFLYAGNMGVAQGIYILLDLAEKMKNYKFVGFLFVGRGSEFLNLKALAKQKNLDNLLFYDEIDPDEIPELLNQCDAGIVTLDNRHKSHNIPGKFLTYIQSGLPVLANINKGNDLAKMIRKEEIGQVCESNQVGELQQLTECLLHQIKTDPRLSVRCKNFFKREFTVSNKVKEIVCSISEKE